jgi:hypothetical protein
MCRYSLLASNCTSASDLLFLPNRNHYGEEFRLELVDASTDVLVGISSMTAHSLILDQKDELGLREGYSLFQALRGPVIWKGKRTIKLLLRHDKKGSGNQKDTAGSGKSARSFA